MASNMKGSTPLSLTAIPVVLSPPFLSENGGSLSSSSSMSSPREVITAPIVMVTASMYSTLTDARFVCSEEACELAAKHQVPIVCVDDSPNELHDKVKAILEAKGKGWVRIAKFKGKGRKAASIRQAIGLAMRWRQSKSNFAENIGGGSRRSDRWVVAFSEFEKSDFLNHIKTVCAPILANEADIVTPERDAHLFRETYPSEQYHSESLAMSYLNLIFMREGGKCDLDWLFGPLCWEGNSVSPFYLESTEESWDAQIIPSIRAWRRINARWTGVRIPYRHPHLQREEEQGSLEFCEKRMLQLNLMTTVLPKAIVNEGRLPIVIVAGAAGNLGKKIVARLLTTAVTDTIFSPASSRPNTPCEAVDLTQPSPTKFKIILMDRTPCPNDLDLTNTNGHEVEYVMCDFLKYEASWAKRFEWAYSAFLLAAQNPFPEATSEDAFASMVINSNLLEACSAGKVDRVVYASSNHVVGSLRTSSGAKIAASAPPTFGTKYSVPGASMDSTLYASAKAAAESQARAMIASGRLQRVIILRIGWCQPGENLISTISVTGTPTIKEDNIQDGGPSKRQKSQDDSEKKDILDWFQGMHLSNEDLDQIVDCCVAPGLEKVPNKLMYVNAMSNYPKSRWNVLDNDIGYHPRERIIAE